MSGGRHTHMGKRSTPIPKPGRSQITVRTPTDYLERYKQLAEAEGLAVNDYITAVLAAAHGFPEPDYLAEVREKARLKRQAEESHLPLAV